MGLPLVHIAIGPAGDGRSPRGIASGWIAIGDVAFGVLFAAGGLAFGGISVGGLALGLLSLGGLSLGLLAAGGLALGFVAAGGAAFAWHVAIGGFAMAHDYALGGAASARETFTAHGGTPPWSSIPHPPFLWSDAVILMLLVALVIGVVLSIHGRRDR